MQVLAKWTNMGMKLEQLSYWLIWVGSVFYSLWSFSTSCQKHFHDLDPNDFVDGWVFLQKQDNSDIEWIILTSTFKKYWMLLVLQVVCSYIISRKWKSVLPLFYALYSTSCLALIIGGSATLLFLFYIAAMFSVHLAGKLLPCYIVTVCALFFPFIMDIKAHLFESELESFLFEVALGWLSIKCLSFGVDRIQSLSHKSITVEDISLVLSYCFYMPTVFTGPILPYSAFSNQVSKCSYSSPNTFASSCVYLLYFLAWYFVFEFLLHFVYSSAVQYNPELCSTWDSWSLCGLGYALPMMFYLKYFVIYGTMGCIAAMEDIQCPPPPKCISSIHSSSYLYRHFDRGLYFWILRYLYRPMPCRALGLLASFGFVCVWHGMERPVCAWTLMNLCLVATEMLGKSLLLPGEGGLWAKKGFSLTWQKRLCALFSTPHFVLMCLSCTFFLSNWDIGVLLFRRVLLTGCIPMLPIAMILFCGCRVSMDARGWNPRKVTPPDL